MTAGLTPTANLPTGSDSAKGRERYRPGLFAWALFTTAAVFPLIALGGLVTSLRAGMVDPQSVRVPWYMLTMSWHDTAEAHGIGYLIEHGHRQLGWIVGLLAIVLAVWVTAVSRDRITRLTAWVALVGVGMQGILGILRVELNRAGWGLEFAMIHGITGHLVFALVAAMPLMLSRGWIEAVPLAVEGGPRFRKVCRLTLGLIMGQLVVGVWLRQFGAGDWSWALWLHLFLAAAVLAHAVMLVVRTSRPGLRTLGELRWPSMILLGLVLGQIAVGAAAWWFGAGEGAMDHRPVSAERAGFTTAHVGLGALALMTIFLLVLRCSRHLTAGRVDEPMSVTAGAA
ncbi:MAG: COX15/CtaA family protein [Gemmatales bacterium]|nr:COX15/CtaA family protein [Gemmatales bacterium]MDW8385560.1 COX15/CtaA family protein [Gemmatales bacterium]